MARTKDASGRLRPYNLTPKTLSANNQELLSITSAPTAELHQLIHTAPYLEHDPEAHRAAQILMNIYQEDASCATARKAQPTAINRPELYAHDVHMIYADLTMSDFAENEDLEILISPTKQVTERVASRRSTTRGKAVANIQPWKKRPKIQYNDEEANGDTTERNSSSSSNNRKGRDSDYLVEKHTRPTTPAMIHRFFSSTPSINTPHNLKAKPLGYTTPLSPSVSPISTSSSVRSTIVLTQQSSSRPELSNLRKPPQASPNQRAELSSITSLQRFLGEVRQSQGHRRTESLDDRGFFEKVSSAHVAMDVANDGGDEEEGEVVIIMSKEPEYSGLNTEEHDFGKEEGTTDDMIFEDLAPTI